MQREVHIILSWRRPSHFLEIFLTENVHGAHHGLDFHLLSNPNLRNAHPLSNLNGHPTPVHISQRSSTPDETHLDGQIPVNISQRACIDSGQVKPGPDPKTRRSG